jgi:hypothetical protein
MWERGEERGEGRGERGEGRGERGEERGERGERKRRGEERYLLLGRKRGNSILELFGCRYLPTISTVS